MRTTLGIEHDVLAAAKELACGMRRALMAHALLDQASSQRFCSDQGLPSSSQNDPSTRRRC